jgi:ABC-type multidrug transport system permease subunit
MVFLLIFILPFMSFFENISEITNKNVTENQQTSDNSGFADMYKSLYSGAGSAITKIIKLVIGVFVLLILLFVGYKIYEKKKSMTRF